MKLGAFLSVFAFMRVRMWEGLRKPAGFIIVVGEEGWDALS